MKAGENVTRKEGVVDPKESMMMLPLSETHGNRTMCKWEKKCAPRACRKTLRG